jgi:uncharacterized membrane protein YdbT with pleckstrin-like domain
MSNYVKNNLNAKEILVKQGTIHWIALLPPAIVMCLFVLLAAISGDDGGVMWMVFAFLSVLWMLPVLKCMLFNALGLTNKRVIGKVNLIWRKTIDSPLNKIDSVSVKRGLFGMFLGYGTICIKTSREEFAFTYMKRPNDFKNMVMEQIDKYEESKFMAQTEGLTRQQQ